MRMVPATPEAVRHVAEHLRQRDAMEVFCAHGRPAVVEVYMSWKNSLECFCIEGDDGEPVGLCGIVLGGMIWMLGTDELLGTASHRRQFIRLGQDWVAQLLADGMGPLYNWALASNRTTLRWLRWLGFEIGTPEPMGPCAQLFCYFEKG